MKRVKFILSAITVFALVGGMLAFKANKFDDAYCIGKVFESTDTSPQNCTTRVLSTITTSSQASFRWAKVTTGANCNSQTCTATLKLTDQPE